MTINSMVPVLQRPRRGKFMTATACALLAVGIGGIAAAQTPPPPGAGAAGRPQAVMLLTPVAIGKLQAADVVAVKGSVAEIYGNKFILQDDTGRMLVELGPQGEDANVVTKDEQVAVQGRFDRGFIVAQVVSHADGRNQAFGPPGPPPRPDKEADRGPGRRPPPLPR